MTEFGRTLLALTTLAFCAAAGSAHAAIKAEGIPELRPPRGTLEEPPENRARWPWLVAAACLAASAILLWPRKRTVASPTPPSVIARRELRALRPPEPVALGQILRNYITATHAVPGPAQTFEQLAAVLEDDPRWTPVLRERFRRLADPLEIAKFAPGAPAADLEQLREEALALIEDAEALRRPAVPAAR